MRAIFDLYLEHEALLPVVQELERRGWVNKRWTTRKGHERGGKPFTQTSLYKLLTNITYTGKVTYKHEVHPGEHAAIVDEAIWQRVQMILRRNGSTGGAHVRNKFGALLKGLLRCASCNCAMTPSHTVKNGKKRYRYYVCSGAQKRGWKTCPSKSIPAGEIEQFVIEQIKCIGRDPSLIDEIVTQVERRQDSDVTDLQAERRRLDKDLAHWNTEVRTLVDKIGSGDNVMSRLADLQERIRQAEQRATEIHEQLITVETVALDRREIALAMSAFEPVWGILTPHEQTRVVQLLVEQVIYDGAAGKVSITFHPTGIKTLACDLATREKIA